MDAGDVTTLIIFGIFGFVGWKILSDPYVVRNWKRNARGGFYFALINLLFLPRLLREADLEINQDEDYAERKRDFITFLKKNASIPTEPEPFIALVNPPAELKALFLDLATRLPFDNETFLRDEYDQKRLLASFHKLNSLLSTLLVSSPPSLFSTSRVERAPSDFIDKLWPILIDCRLDLLHRQPESSLYKFLHEPIPFHIPERLRFEHTFILGGSGAGKTSLLEMMIRADIHAGHSIVVIDSQGHLIPRLAKLAMWKKKPIIIIDPRDRPALNVFDVKRKAHQDQIQNATFQTIKFLLSGLLGATLTPIQTGLFSYCVRLLLTYPQIYKRNATLHDLLALMRMKKIEIPVTHLDPEDRDFFEHDFGSPQYMHTKAEVMVKLRAVLGYKLISSLVAAPFSTIDFFHCFNKGAVILVDTSLAYLQKDSSSYMGQIVFSMVMNAVFERGLYPDRSFPPVWVYADEAHEYFNAPIDEFLTGARKYKAGLTIATQRYNLMSDPLREAVASSTSIKFAGKLGDDPARWMAKNMRTDAEFIFDQKPYHFACHLSGMKNAVSVSTTPNAIDGEPTLTEREYKTLRAINRYYVSGQAWQEQEDPEFYEREEYAPPRREREAQHPAEIGLALPPPSATSDETNW